MARLTRIEIEELAEKHYGPFSDFAAGDDLHWHAKEALFVLLIDVGDVLLAHYEADMNRDATLESPMAGRIVAPVEMVVFGLQDHLEDRQEGVIPRVPGVEDVI